jgi:hypothetical protein
MGFGMPTIQDLPKLEAVFKVGNGKFAVISLHNLREFIQKIALTGKVEEGEYVGKYPDVAEAIRANKVANATEHYLKWGYLEQRIATLIPEVPDDDRVGSPSSTGTKFGQS